MSGLLGVFTFEGIDVFPLLYYGLYALQHRGQQAVSIASLDDRGRGQVHSFDGRIADSFGRGKIDHMDGNKGLALVKDGFFGQGLPAMPLLQDDSLLAIDGCIISQGFDPYDLVRALRGTIGASKDYLAGLEGAFALLYLDKDKFIAYKGKDGIKPLCIGRAKGLTVASSESSALDAIGARLIREVQAGELLVQTRSSLTSYYLKDQLMPQENIDAFEYIYTARPDSVIDGISVYQARYSLGQRLYEEEIEDIGGIVVGAPQSGIIAGLGYAQASGKAYQQGFLKNRYVARTFMEPVKEDREISLRIKVNPIKSVVANRKIILVDDSMVRGSTMKRTVMALKEAGASQVHVRLASPPIINDESLTMDIAGKEELIAYGRTKDEIKEILHCDSLNYISLEGFHRAIGRDEMYEPYFKKEGDD